MTEPQDILPRSIERVAAHTAEDISRRIRQQTEDSAIYVAEHPEEIGNGLDDSRPTVPPGTAPARHWPLFTLEVKETTGRRRPKVTHALALLPLAVAACTGSGATGPAASVAGAPESARTTVLETGAATLQRDAPTDGLDIYLVGFHPMKDNPSHQFEAHHFCKQVNEDFMQCALYDGNTAAANLNGLEYIISEKLFETLPEEEKQYWHPHNGEILSGQLVAPGLPAAADHALMKSKMNSYGKTWHTWDTSHGGGGGQSLPLGAPKLAWSFSRFGEVRPGLVENRDRRMDMSTEERRRGRQDLIPMARPQSGVDVLKGQFQGPTQPIPGVVDKHPARQR